MDDSTRKTGNRLVPAPIVPFGPAGHVTAVRLGAVVRRARLRCGLSQEALAERAGLSVQHLQRIENARSHGSPNVTLRTMEKLAVGFGAPKGAVVALFEWLVGLAGAPQAGGGPGA